jgi:hypothetical protein
MSHHNFAITLPITTKKIIIIIIITEQRQSTWMFHIHKTKGGLTWMNSVMLRKFTNLQSIG